jgi:hypothetical protein
MLETFADDPASRWRFFTDTVMGGVSSGELQFGQENDRHWARLTGRVSTANNGGFIQMQRRLGRPQPVGSGGVRLVARGNDQRYFIHLRLNGATSPTAFHRAGFATIASWCETHLPFHLFTAARPGMSALQHGDSITSVAVVAFGRDHHADISISEIAFYSAVNA